MPPSVVANTPPVITASPSKLNAVVLIAPVINPLTPSIISVLSSANTLPVISPTKVVPPPPTLFVGINCEESASQEIICPSKIPEASTSARSDIVNC